MELTTNASGPPTPWVYSDAVVHLARAGGLITLVEGDTFCLSDVNGDLVRARPHGLFVLDTRILSSWEVVVDGAPVDPLAVHHVDPYRAHFVGRVPPPPGVADSTLIVFRERTVSDGMRERITLQNVGLEPVEVRVAVRCSADFADLFEVKERRADHPDAAVECASPTTLVFVRSGTGATLRTHLDFSQPTSGPAAWDVRLEPGATWTTDIDAWASSNGVAQRAGSHDEQHAALGERLAQWRAASPRAHSDFTEFDAAIERGVEDLGALRMFDTSHTSHPIVAAGAPWFMALFGRDSLLTSWMALPATADLAVGVTQTLAALQGVDVDPETEEQPGRILHESRLGMASDLSLRGGSTYYGTADATPLFVMLVGEMDRWGVEAAAIDALMPHVDAALAWIEEYGDRDGDGYVEYARSSPTGLANQGWKDSWDGVRFADGRLADAPIALCEVQAYVYGAYRARASLARSRGEPDAAVAWDARANTLRRRFHRDFWMPEHGWFALGLDRDKRQIDALASNVGHCLWTGIVDDALARPIADRLVHPEFFSGWGVRTLATSMRAYNPVSYHNGSVWPHDTAICAAGLSRYGLSAHANRLIEGLVAAAHHHEARLPELFAGFAREQVGVPAAYPTSCSPQAWAAAAPLLMLRSVLRLDPDIPAGRIFLAPELPDAMTTLSVTGLAVGDRRLDVHVADGRIQVGGAHGLEVVPHPPTTRPHVPRA